MKKKPQKTLKKTKKATVKRAEKMSAKLSIGKEIWPLERDVLFRPDRLKYVRKLIVPEGCVFCSAAGSEVGFERLLVYKSQLSMVVMNKYPYNPGHLLVLPLRHCGDLLNLSDEEYRDLQDVVRRSFAALQKAFNPGGINLGLNHGAVAGAGIPDHLHYHLIPRWSGDLNFFPLIAETKAIPASLEDSYNRLLEAFS